MAIRFRIRDHRLRYLSEVADSQVVFDFSSGFPYNIGTKQNAVGSIEGNAPIERGQGLILDGVGNRISLGSVFDFGSTSLNFSLLVGVTLFSTSTKGAFLKVGDASTGYGLGVGLNTFDSNGNEITALNEGVSWFSTDTNIGTGFHVLELFRRGATLANFLYLDSTFVAQQTSTEGIAPANSISVGGYPTNRFPVGILHWAIVAKLYDQDLSAGSISDRGRLRALYPAGIWRPYTVRRRYSLHKPAAAGGATLTAAHGTYAISGQAVAVKRAVKLAAAQGSYALAGQAALLVQARKIAAAQGSYSLTGQSASLIHGLKLVAAQGAYTLTGQAVLLPRGYRITAAQGSYNLAGQAATLTKSSGATLLANQGSYTLAGQAVAFRRAYTLTAAQGAYALSGQAAALHYGRTLVAGQGSYALTGQAVNLTAQKLLTAAHGIYVLAGQDVTLTAPSVELVYPFSLAVSDAARTSLSVSDSARTSLTVSDS